MPPGFDLTLPDLAAPVLALLVFGLLALALLDVAGAVAAWRARLDAAAAPRRMRNATTRRAGLALRLRAAWLRHRRARNRAAGVSPANPWPRA